MKRWLLWISWAISFSVALLAAALLLQGVLRDTRAGEPTVRIDFSAASDWKSIPFRVWGAGRYAIFVSSVNHDPALTGRALNAAFEVRVMTPEGRTYFHQRYAPGSTGHVLPDNYGDRRLALLDLDGNPLQSWLLRYRVTQPDRGFPPNMTELKLWKERPDPGMGGLMNYVMIIPALFFTLVAGILATVLAAKKHYLPLGLTVPLALAVFAAFIAP